MGILLFGGVGRRRAVWYVRLDFSALNARYSVPSEASYRRAKSVVGMTKVRSVQARRHILPSVLAANFSLHCWANFAIHQLVRKQNSMVNIALDDRPSMTCTFLNDYLNWRMQRKFWCFRMVFFFLQNFFSFQFVPALVRKS